MSLTPQQQQQQQQKLIHQDLLGFAHFDTIDQLKQWDKNTVDPLQRANTPLLVRPPVVKGQSPDQSSTVFVMTDYDGGYLTNLTNNIQAYEACQGSVVSREYYIMEQWQRIEAFNYFNHYRLSIPPPTWVNAGHRNGALVLGTFLIEGSDNLSPMLDKDPQTPDKYILAEKLAQMAEFYGFDGYLINIETSFPPTGNDPSGVNAAAQVAGLLGQLKEELVKRVPSGKVIWYDALTPENEVVYQNTLNGTNLPLAQGAGSMVTNYKWQLEPPNPPTDIGAVTTAVETLGSAAAKGMHRNQVYFGVDLFAQDNDSRSPNTRYTYGLANDSTVKQDLGNGITVGNGPIKDAVAGNPSTGSGYGGTAVGLAMALLASQSQSGETFGAGIFACGWAYTHFPLNNVAKYVDRYMWEGKPDLRQAENHREVHCRCDPCLAQHIRNDTGDNPISKSATRFPAGSEQFFYTNYKDVFTPQSDGSFRADLGQQSVLPTPGERSGLTSFSPEPISDFDNKWLIQLKDSPPRACVGIQFDHQQPMDGWNGDQGRMWNDADRLDALVKELPGKTLSIDVPLHQLNANTDIGLEVLITSQKATSSVSGFSFTLFGQIGSSRETFDLGDSPDVKTQTWTLAKTADRLTSIGITVSGPAENLSQLIKDGAPLDLLAISSILIRPQGTKYSAAELKDVAVAPKGTDISLHHRLSWAYDNAGTGPASLPWSNVTGPFSYFTISADGKEVGRAYALAFAFDRVMSKAWATAGKQVQIDIVGYGFDGSKIASVGQALTFSPLS